MAVMLVDIFRRGCKANEGGAVSIDAGVGQYCPVERQYDAGCGDMRIRAYTSAPKMQGSIFAFPLVKMDLV